MLSILFQVIYLLLYFFLLTLLARFVLSAVLQYGRRWQPGRGAAAGLAFGLRGTIERVTNRVFLLSPANVQVTAEDKAKIAEGGFFNQS